MPRRRLSDHIHDWQPVLVRKAQEPGFAEIAPIGPIERGWWAGWACALCSRWGMEQADQFLYGLLLPVQNTHTAKGATNG